jgi:hypothetical protein
MIVSDAFVLVYGVALQEISSRDVDDKSDNIMDDRLDYRLDDGLKAGTDDKIERQINRAFGS